MHYLCKERVQVLSTIEDQGYLDKYTNILHGLDLINAFQDGHIGKDNIVLIFLINSIQLYAKKLSAC